MSDMLGKWGVITAIKGLIGQAEAFLCRLSGDGSEWVRGKWQRNMEKGWKRYEHQKRSHCLCLRGSHYVYLITHWPVSQWPWYIFSSPSVLVIIDASLGFFSYVVNKKWFSPTNIFHCWKFQTGLRNSDLVSHVLHWDADGGECSVLIHLDLTVTFSTVN